MPLEVNRKDKESSRKLVRRFSRVIRQTGILKRAKRIQFRHRPLSDSKKKVAALRRIEMRKKYQEVEEEEHRF